MNDERTTVAGMGCCCGRNTLKGAETSEDLVAPRFEKLTLCFAFCVGHDHSLATSYPHREALLVWARPTELRVWLRLFGELARGLCGLM